MVRQATTAHIVFSMLISSRPMKTMPRIMTPKYSSTNTVTPAATGALTGSFSIRTALELWG